MVITELASEGDHMKRNYWLGATDLYEVSTLISLINEESCLMFFSRLFPLLAQIPSDTITDFLQNFPLLHTSLPFAKFSAKTVLMTKLL